MSAALKEEGFVEARIARLESDVAHIRSDVSEIKTDIRDLKKDVGGLKGEVVELRSKIGETAADLRTDIAKASLSITIWGVGLFIIVMGAMAHGFKWL